MRKGVYRVIGIGLLAAGVLGFIQNPALGLFTSTPFHNLLHLGSGLATVMAAGRGILAMRHWGTINGLLYAALSVAGLTLRRGDFFGLVHLDRPDNWLHAGLAAVFLYYAWLAPPR